MTAAGPFFAVAALLAVAGVAKLARPTSTATALRAAGLPSSTSLARLVGAVEIAVAAGAVLTGSRAAAALVAAVYLGFAAFTLRLIARQGGTADCGCFGSPTAPATRFHVAADLAAAAVAGFAVATPPGGIVSVLGDQPLAGVPFLALVALCTWLAQVSYTLLPELAQARDANGRAG